MLAYDLSAPRSFVSKRVVDGRHVRGARLSARAVPAHGGPIRDPLGAAQLLASAERELLQPRGEPSAQVGDGAARRHRSAAGRASRRTTTARWDDWPSRRTSTADVAKVGDPLVLTVRVIGRRQRELLPAARGARAVGAARAGRGARAARLERDRRSRREGIRLGDHAGAKRRRRGPAIRYPYFNPYTERYELAVTTPQHRVGGAGHAHRRRRSARTRRGRCSRCAALCWRRRRRRSRARASSGSRCWSRRFRRRLALVMRRPRTRRVPTRGRAIAEALAAAIDTPTPNDAGDAASHLCCRARRTNRRRGRGAGGSSRARPCTAAQRRHRRRVPRERGRSARRARLRGVLRQGRRPRGRSASAPSMCCVRSTRKRRPRIVPRYVDAIVGVGRNARSVVRRRPVGADVA